MQFRLVLFGAFLFAVCAAPVHIRAAQTVPAPPAITEEAIEQSLRATPLLHTIYQANREKGRESEKLLEQAYELAKSATAEQVNAAPRPLLRTALHLTVLGSLQAHPGGRLETYLRLAEALIGAGADVNAADMFGVTPLDMQRFSESADMGDLLAEYGASRRVGISLAEDVMPLFQQVTALAQKPDLAQLRRAVHSDLPLGGFISLRLLGPVSSNHSRPGDIVQAVTIAPVLDGARVTVPSGTLLEGVVTQAVPAGNQYERARLGMVFLRIAHPNGAYSRLFARWVGVDNARETIQPNVAIGMAFPRSQLDKIGWGSRIAGFAYPGLGYAVQAATWGFSQEVKREIEYEAGVDLTLEVLLPATMKQIPPDPPPATFADASALSQFVNRLPMRSTNLEGKDADVTNVLFIGTKEEITEAFLKAGWLAASDLSTGSALKTFAATALERGYSEAPLSQLYLEKKLPEMEFEKQNDTFAKRHHLRIYQRTETFEGHPVWLAAATHDTGIRAMDKGAKWTHAVDPHIDGERNKIGIDLVFSGKVKGVTLVDRPKLPHSNESIAGHPLLTDGRALVLGFANASPLLHARRTWDETCILPASLQSGTDVE